LEDISALEPILLKIMNTFPIYEQSPDWKSKVKILNLGCGNSILAEDLYDRGFTSVYNMDISTVVI
jgi:2-polyprenyl-3-methyl-5-hydroxy-6-metoxy-1,4-benzoquinol methylase